MKSFNEWLDEGSFLHHMGNSAKYAMSAVGFTDKNKFDRVNALKFWKKYLEQPMPFPRSWTDPRFSGLLRILNGTEDQYTTFGWDIYMSPKSTMRSPRSKLKCGGAIRGVRSGSKYLTS